MDAKSCIIEKDTTFTYSTTKMLHILASKNVQRYVYLYTCYNNRVYLHGYYSFSIYYFSICFSLLSVSLSDQLFFSLSSLYLTLTSLSFSHLINCWRRRSLTQASGWRVRSLCQVSQCFAIRPALPPASPSILLFD